MWVVTSPSLIIAWEGSSILWAPVIKLGPSTKLKSPYLKIFNLITSEKPSLYIFTVYHSAIYSGDLWLRINQSCSPLE
jgi:hypothetical protein